MKTLRALALGTVLAGIASAGSIDDLGSDDFKTREKAHAAFLAKADDPKTIEQLEVASKHPDPEIARRAELILRNHREKQITDAITKIKESCQGRLPWLCRLPITKSHLNSGFQGSGSPPEWQGYRDATEHMLDDLLRRKVDVDIEALVEEMKAAELQFIEQQGRFYQPPLTPTWRTEITAK